jgi:alpha-glucosidase
MELSAFADCMFRSHEGNQADKQIQVWDNLDLTKAFAKWSNIHSMLAPLRKGLMTEAREKGWPLVRGMWFKYGDLGWGNREQYMLGEHMLVSPIMDEGMIEKKVWLPRGEWVDFNTCKTIVVEEEKGINVVAKAEVGTTPVFVVKGDRKAMKVVKRIWRRYKYWDNDGAKECEKYAGMDIGVMLRRIRNKLGF